VLQVTTVKPLTIAVAAIRQSWVPSRLMAAGLVQSLCVRRVRKVLKILKVAQRLQQQVVCLWYSQGVRDTVWV